MFENPENSSEFCQQAGTPDIIQARLRGEGDAVALTRWQNHLASCPQCQKAVEQEAFVRAAFATYCSDNFFRHLSAGWQPDLSGLANSADPPLQPSVIPAEASFDFEANGNSATSQPKTKAKPAEHQSRFRSKRVQLSWPVALVSGLLAVASLSILLLLVVSLSVTSPAVQPAPALELVWQVDGKAFGMLKPAGLALDKPGNIYVAEQNYHYIKKLDAKGQLITRWGGMGQGEGQFNLPTAIAIDRQGYVYVSDTGNQRIQKFDSNGQFISSWGQAGSAEGEFNQPWGVALDSQGAVYVVDSANARVQKFDEQGNFLATWGSYGQGKGQFSAPRAIVADKQGQIYISDAGRGSIQKFTASGQFLSEWQLPVNKTNSTLFTLELALDEPGNLYVSDQSWGLIYKFTPEGKLVASLSSLTVGNLFRQPAGIALDSQSEIVVADGVTSALLKFRQSS